MSTDELFSTDVTFATLGLNEPLLKGLAKLGYTRPTMVQAELIPPALAGRDVLGQSKTGTGKTIAFGLPLFQMIEEDRPLSALILVPTRELASQVTTELQAVGEFTGRGVVAIFGGQRIVTQAQRLKRDPHIIVGTPGRVMDMHQRGMLPYDNIRFAVLDEVDRMLDIGFRDDIRRILGGIKSRHQTIFVSATISPEIETLARQYMRDPVKLTVTAKSLTVSQVSQVYFAVERWDKNRLLLHLLTHETPALTLVFCRTKQTVDRLSEYLAKKGIDVHAIHGDMYQGKRNRVMEMFRAGDLSVVIASDLASRGLDVEGISHVVNYDLPEDPEVYVHRIGRTARVGRDGIAWSFVTSEQGDLLTAIEKLTNVEIPIKEYDDFKPGPVPPDVLAQRQRAVERTKETRVQASRVPVLPTASAEVADSTKFPGGLVPVAMPSKRMGGRLKSSRR